MRTASIPGYRKCPSCKGEGIEKDPFRISIGRKNCGTCSGIGMVKKDRFYNYEVVKTPEGLAIICDKMASNEEYTGWDGYSNIQEVCPDQRSDVGAWYEQDLEITGKCKNDYPKGTFQYQ